MNRRSDLQLSLGHPRFYANDPVNPTSDREVLTRLAGSGADAFTTMRIAGHRSVVISQRYVHPSVEALGQPFE